LLCRFDGSTGAFRLSSPGILDSLSSGISCSNLEAVSKRKLKLQKLLVEVKEVAAEELEMLERSSDVVIGMRIIQQFVIDLLGRNTPMATIFRTKTEAE
jgi:hypothetical protein